MGCGPSKEENAVAEPRPKRAINSMAFLIQRSHVQGTDLPESRAYLNRMDMIDVIDLNAEFMKSYETKSDDNRPACLRGKRVQEYLNRLFLAKAALKPPQPNIEVTPCMLINFY